MLSQSTFETISGRPRQTGLSMGSCASPVSLFFDSPSIAVPRDCEIFGEGEPVEYLYKVVSGMVRGHKILSDGRRQVAAFYMRGDVFGLETGSTHSFTAEAVVNAKVLAVRRTVLHSLAKFDGEVARQLWALTGLELERARKHSLLLAKTAPERMASFLLEISERAQSNEQVELPMPRQDIADHLGLTIETVSRTLTRLENASAIAVPTTKRVVVRDQALLRELNA